MVKDDYDGRGECTHDKSVSAIIIIIKCSTNRHLTFNPPGLVLKYIISHLICVLAQSFILWDVCFIEKINHSVERRTIRWCGWHDTDDDDDKSQCSTQEAVCVPFVLAYCLQRNICYVSRLAVYEAQKAGGEKDRLLVTMMTIAKSAINCRFTILIEGAGVSVALSEGD